MKEYNYWDIVQVDKMGILFSDGEFIEFEECKCEWARDNNIPVRETVCVASRFTEGDDRYYVFYSKEKIKLHFSFKGLFKKKKSRDKFTEFQVLLNRYGYTSFDCS